MGHNWDAQTSEEIWDELRSVSPAHWGMTYAKLDALGRHSSGPSPR